jgi:hypothetical protein
MAEPTQPVSPINNKQESVTTREEMNWDDNEHEQETGRVSPLGNESTLQPVKKSPSPKPRVSFQDQSDEIPPSKPPRPQSPQQQAEHTLIEAFPSIDAKVVRAVLMASGGKVEPAFNALLGMTDPDFQPEEAPPPQPPRPAQRQQQQQQQPRQPRNQLEADEMYARQLAEHYNSQGPDQGRGQQTRYNQRERQGPNQQRPRYEEEDREHSFFDDDLPEIGRNIQRGFAETQKQVNSWITTFKKRIDGDDNDDDEDLYSGPSSSNARPSRQNFGPSQSEQMYGIRKSAEHQTRRSVEQQRYDSDPHVLDDAEFSRLELRDDEARELSQTTICPFDHTLTHFLPAPAQPPRTSSRLPTNPDLFKPQPKPPQTGPVDEVDAFDRNASSSANNNNNNNNGAKKWQPLTSVAPHPEEDNDPFALGDDDEEIGNSKSEDLRKEDSERLKSAARASVNAGSSGEEKVKPAESEVSGTKNKEAEELLAGGKKQ